MTGLTAAPALPEELPIGVTDDDIATGQSAVCAFCPVALAVKRALRAAGVAVGDTDVSVLGDSTVLVHLGSYTRTYDFGLACAKWIEQFDCSEFLTAVPAPAPATFVGVLMPPPRLQPEEGQS